MKVYILYKLFGEYEDTVHINIAAYKSKKSAMAARDRLLKKNDFLEDKEALIEQLMDTLDYIFYKKLTSEFGEDAPWDKATNEWYDKNTWSASFKNFMSYITNETFAEKSELLSFSKEQLVWIYEELCNRYLLPSYGIDEVELMD